MRKWSLIIGGVLVTGILGLIGWWGYGRTQTYFGQEPYRLVVWEETATQPRVTVVAFYPTGKMATIYLLSNEKLIDTAYGYGQYRTGALRDLDKQEKMGGELVKKTLTLNLGMFIRSMVSTKVKNVRDMDASWIRGVMFTHLRQAKNLQQKLEALTGWWQVLDLKSNKIEIADLQTRPVWRGMPGNAGGECFDPVKFDHLVQVPLNKLPQEIAVTVHNETGRRGLAGNLARVLEREGFLVVAVDSKTDPIKVITTSQLEFKNMGQVTLRLIKQLQTVTGVYPVAQVTLGGRAEVVVTLGNDYRGF